MSSNDTLPISYLDRPLRTEAEALADHIEKRLERYGEVTFGEICIGFVPGQYDLIIRALRAYKPAPVTDTHNQFDGGEA